ncbi:MAG: CoA-transferase subunit beta [Methylocystaceae bacterium]|nr:CoA-transferase subunit beta [Methylocystaceae bacterium]
MRDQDYTLSELMSIVASRMLTNDDVCFVGIGLPSEAANLARLTHAPDIKLIYESGTLVTRPDVLPLSIGDGELSDTALSVVSVPEMFRYWLQGGKIKVGFLGAAQIDKFANLNTTSIGDYKSPKVRLPGAGGAPEIASHAAKVFITLKHSTKAFVEKLDFITSVGFLEGGDSRDKLNLPGSGPQMVITDLGILEPDPITKELVLTHVHPGVTVEQIKEATGWNLLVADSVKRTEPPTDKELEVLRDIKLRTKIANSGAAK